MALNLHVQKPFPEARTYMEALLGYTFTNENLLREALHAGGPITIHGRLVQEANKTLAVVGDAAIHLVIAHDGYVAGRSRGTTTNQEQLIASNENLDRIGRAHGIAECLTCDGGTSHVSSKMMATAVEAILGAMFEDSQSGIQVVRGGMVALGLLSA